MMIPLCVKHNHITDRELVYFGLVRKMLEEDFKEWEESGLTCHTVCQRLAYAFPMQFRVATGQFASFDHSWLAFKSDPEVIIDAYPWACASGPILLTLTDLSPWRFLYKEYATYVEDLKTPDCVAGNESLRGMGN